VSSPPDSLIAESESETASLEASASELAASTRDLPPLGSVVAGKYRIDSILGAGGMGVVVAATHLVLGEHVAIKFLGAGAGRSAVERFRREAQVAIRIKSEHIVRLMDVGTLPSGAPFLVMEHLEGSSLAELLRRRGPLPVAEAVDLVLQALEAIAEAHQLGVVHRDLKPSNLFATERADGSVLVKVLDFGIAKLLEGHARNAIAHAKHSANKDLTATTMILGSPSYMAPEQVRSARAVDARADVWSLGVVLHELCSGKLPFEAESPSGVMAAIVADAPTPLCQHRPSAPRALEEIVLRCLEKDRERRFQDVGELARALSSLATDAALASIERVTRTIAHEDARSTGDRSKDAPRLAPATDPSPTASAFELSRTRKAGPSWRLVGAAAVVVAGAFFYLGRAREGTPATAATASAAPADLAAPRASGEPTAAEPTAMASAREPERAASSPEAPPIRAPRAGAAAPGAPAKTPAASSVAPTPDPSAPAPFDIDAATATRH
jgi:eukaryotic-like serine/threonine-protein kinase